MATSNIKLFDENKVNMMPDEAYQVETQRTNGVQSGVASSQLQNKTLYQVSLVSYAIAQIMNQNGLNANDSDAVSTFVNNLSSTMLQKVQDIATTAEAQAGVINNKWMSPALVKTAIDVLAAKSQNILSNATKTLYGLGANAVPDDVFGVLSRFQNGLGNEYVWAKGGVTLVPTFTNTGDTDIKVGSGSSVTISFYNRVEIVGGNPVLSDLWKTITATGANVGTNLSASVLNVGVKYFKASDGTVCATVPGSSNVQYSAGEFFMFGYKWYAGTSEKFSTIGYVNSPDPNAYPPAVDDGYTYNLLGQLGNKVQIATGSYTGTGSKGSSSKNSLTFDFAPKLVFIEEGTNNGEGLFMVNPAPFVTWVGNHFARIAWSGNTVSWYSDNNAADQANVSRSKYYWIAIG